MKAKRKIGMGCKSSRKDKNCILIARKKRKQMKTLKNGKRLILTPNHTGGALPLAAIFAGLSALGSLASGALSVYNAVKNRKKKREWFIFKSLSG